MKTCTESEWNRFIDKWFTKCIYDFQSCDTTIDRLINRFEKTCIIVNKRTGRSAIARCCDCDEFSSKIGLAIAYARYRGQEIPKIV